MDSSKISSTYSSCTPPPEAPKNRFEPLTFSKNFHHQKTWSAIEQKMPHCMSTALKVVLILPLYLIEGIARGMEAIGNAGVWTLNKLGGRSAEAVDTSKPDHPPAKEVYSKPILEADPSPLPHPICWGLDPDDVFRVEKTFKEPAPDPLETETLATEEPSAPVIETPTSTTTTLIEKEPGEDTGGWEWDVNNPDQIRVRYPEPVVPSNKINYLKTALGVVGLAAIAIPTLYYGYNFTRTSPTHAWRMVTDYNPNEAFICMQTPCNGTFDCVDNCPENLIPRHA